VHDQDSIAQYDTNAVNRVQIIISSHSRTTILPMEKDLADMLERFVDFHCNFRRKYGID